MKLVETVGTLKEENGLYSDNQGREFVVFNKPYLQINEKGKAVYEVYAVRVDGYTDEEFVGQHEANCLLIFDSCDWKHFTIPFANADDLDPRERCSCGRLVAKTKISKSSNGESFCNNCVGMD